jgi:hypothetical protein
MDSDLETIDEESGSGYHDFIRVTTLNQISSALVIISYLVIIDLVKTSGASSPEVLHMGGG